MCIDTNGRRNLTYHFSGTEVFWVHLHMYHPCLLATANLLLILSLPPGKKEILAGTKSFPHLLQDSSAVITSCVVCFLIVSSRQNMSPAFFPPQTHTSFTTCQYLTGHKRGGEWQVKHGRNLSKSRDIGLGVSYIEASQPNLWFWLQKEYWHVDLHNGLSHMSKGPLHKLPHTVHLPCCYDEILGLLLLQHQPHSLKETDTETKTERSNYWEIIKTVRWSTLDRAKLSPDRQEVNLRPLSEAFAHTSALTSLQGLRGHILWERRTEHSHRPTVLLAHKNAHVAMNTRAFRPTALRNWHTLTTQRYFKTHIKWK